MVSRSRQQRGVTLVELIAAIAILAILTGMGAPAFSNVLRNTERSSALNNFWHTTYLARSEAIKRNSLVVMCASRDGQQCSNDREWANGWLVFENLDHDQPARVDANEPVLQVYPASQGMSIRSNRVTFGFRPFAQGDINGTITFCDQRGDKEARAIIISHTGRPRQSSKDPSNRALHCTA